MVNGKVSGRSICAGALSLIVWPGIGQVVNEEAYEKNITHAILGLTGIFRIWSCYDAVVDRHGGVWENRI
jgi:TM2 domain-containing membrane protein YozV